MFRLVSAALLVTLMIAGCTSGNSSQDLDASEPTATAATAPSETSVVAPTSEPTPTVSEPTPNEPTPSEPTPTVSEPRPSEPTPTVSNIDAFCDNFAPGNGRFAADLDGDGLDETLFRTDTENGTEVRVCASHIGAVEPVLVGGPNKPASVHVVDVDRDGVDELLVGGPTGSAIFVGGLVQLVDGVWQWGQDTPTIRPAIDGFEAQGESFTCVDSDGDGGAGLVPVTYRIEHGLFLWTSAVDSGEFVLPDQWTEAWLLASGTCGNVVTTPLAASAPAALLAVVGTDAAPFNLVAPDAVIGLGLHDQILVERSGAELMAPEGWVIDAESYAQFSGPFSALAVLARLKADDVRLIVGPHDHCAGGPLPEPEDLESLTQLAIQPVGASSCIDWFSVNLFVDAELELRAVTLELFGP